MGRALLICVLLGAASFLGGCAPALDEDTETGISDLTGDENQVAAIKKAVGDVDQEHVVLGASIVAPTIDASTGSESEGASLFGIDWHQKWAGGKSSDHEWANGSDLGRRCAWASIARFEAIMADPPEELADLRAKHDDWDGAFTNWNDDYGGTTKDGKPAYGDAKAARIMATPSGAVKWVSATAKDGSCYLPTKAMLSAFATSCAKKSSVAGCSS
ncbi:MAG: hypothetical protein KIT84_20720 [Labilithrix sp.]|nr:hypothetical protein [Labilithrix sp.]MCW5813465.1 hypothetical protein [Labilithrix sp.]